MTNLKTEGRPKGTVVPTKSGLWQGIITLADGRRHRLKPFPKGTSRAMAEERTAWATEHRDELETPLAPVPTIEAYDADTSPAGVWFKAWLADRVARGYSTTRDNATSWRLYLQPILGNGSPKTWKREHFRKISASLDAKIQDGSLAWKSARNIWATATKMANDAAESKQAKIRVREDDPAQGVKGPDKGDEIGKQFLYPAEFLKVVSHPDVPELWKRLVTVAVYSYLRDGELRALECADVDTEHGVIRVTKAWNRKLKRVTSPKGGRAREVPIEPALLPLLRQLKAERGDVGKLLDMPSGSNAARALVTWLKKAGVERAELHNHTPTTRPIRFHDLRGTGITWRAVRDDRKFELQIDAGHTDFATTEKYLHLASARRRGFGAPFPALPNSFCDHPSDHPFASGRKVKSFGGEDRIRTGV